MNQNHRKFRFASSKPAPVTGPVPTSASVLTREELRRIVAEMLG